MDQTRSPSHLNRLRAAAGLIPLIEDGLTSATMSPNKAIAMAAFCQWALQGNDTNTAESGKLTQDIQQGLDRIAAQLEALHYDIA